MTEIPEHLLRRSKERRGALGLPGGEDGGAGAPAASTPSASAPAPAAGAAAPPATPRAPREPAAAPPPPPVPAYVQAAHRRRKLPFWAVPALAALPVWGFVYMEAMSPPKVKLAGPLAIGAEVYTNCSSCHGANGEGGVGRPLNNGEVLKSFDTFEEQVEWTKKGTDGFKGQPYGNGRHVGGSFGAMPGFAASLTEAEIEAVVCHERVTMQNLAVDDASLDATTKAKCAATGAGGE
ncbi:MAG: cytochrome c [Acidimicrobiia bacterium]